MTSPTTSQANPDEADRQRHASYLTSLFGVLAGAVVFLPSILGIIKPPFVWEPLLYIFWVAGIVSLVLLAFAIYFLRFATTCAYPHRLSGAGSWLALLALACLVIYVAANGFQDRVSTPHIQSVTINPISPQAGDIVEVSADVTDEDQDRLRYGWTVDGKELAQGQIVYWAVPKAGSYNLQLRVDDGSSKRSQTKSLNVVVSEDKQSMSKESDLINASIMIGLKRVREKDPSKFADAYDTYNASSLPDLVAGHFSPEDPGIYYQVIPQAFESAVMMLPEEQLHNLLLGLELPPCKDYPGLWPLCKK